MLADHLGQASIVLPLAQEQLPEERIQGFLLIAILLASAGVLLLEGGQEPFEYEERSLGRISFLGWRREHGGVLCPV